MYFRVRAGKPVLVPDADCGDVEWCKRWMFIEKSSLGDAGSWILETCIPKGNFVFCICSFVDFVCLVQY